MSSSGLWRCADLAITDVSGITDWWLSLQPPAHVGSPLVNFSTLMMEAIRSSETSVNTRSTQRHNPEDEILQTATGLHPPQPRQAGPLTHIMFHKNSFLLLGSKAWNITNSYIPKIYF
jgi:hypothetical protein